MSPISVPIEILFWVAIGLFSLSILAILYTLGYRLLDERRERAAAPQVEQARKHMLTAMALGPEEVEPLRLPSDRRVARSIVLSACRIINTVTGEGRDNLREYLVRSRFPEWGQERLRSRRPFARAIACELLGSMRVEEAAARIRALITDPDADVRQAAVRAVGRLEDAAAAPTLLASLHRRNGNSPVVVATALLAIGPEGELALAAALQDRDAITRRVAAQVIGLLNLFDARDALVAALSKENDPWTKVQLIRALGRVGGQDVRAPLHMCLAEGPMVRAAAVRALASLDDSQVLEYLRQELSDPSPSVCRATAESLAAAGPAGRATLRDLPPGSSAEAYAREALARIPSQRGPDSGGESLS